MRKSFKSYETASSEIEYKKLFELTRNLNLNGSVFREHPVQILGNENGKQKAISLIRVVYKPTHTLLDFKVLIFFKTNLKW